MIITTRNTGKKVLEICAYEEMTTPEPIFRALVHHKELEWEDEALKKENAALLDELAYLHETPETVFNTDAVLLYDQKDIEYDFFCTLINRGYTLQRNKKNKPWPVNLKVIFKTAKDKELIDSLEWGQWVNVEEHSILS